MLREDQSKLFLYFLPVYYIYNMLIDVVFARGSIAGVVLNVLILLMLLYFSLHNTHNKRFWYIFLWIALNVVLITCNSSKIVYSFMWFAKNLIGLLCFPLSFYLISSNSQIVRLLKVLIVIMLLYVLNLIFANLLGWGNAYGTKNSEFAVQGGASIVTGSMPVVVALMAAPLILLIIPKKKLFIGMWCVTLICVFLIFKRTNIASLIVGYLVYAILFVYYKKKRSIEVVQIQLSKKKILQLSLGFMLLLILLGILLGDVIAAQFEIRSGKFEEGSMAKEGRVIEWELVNNTIFKSGNNSTILFGKEPYNTPRNYGFQTDRNIHGDFSMILFSTGSIGFLFYWGMQLYIALLILKYNKKRYLSNVQDIMLFSAYLSLSAIWFLFSFSSTLNYVLISSVYYMIQGSTLRYFWNKHRRQEAAIALNAMALNQ